MLNVEMEMENIRTIGFDLDDTLHRFTSAAHQGGRAITDRVSEWSGQPADHVADTYGCLLAEAQRANFATNKTSHDYRKERFGGLLDRFDLPIEQHIEELLALYEKVIAENMQLNAGALNILSVARNNGKTIAVITEGPRDAQERTLKYLHLDKLVDSLITSAEYEKSKTDGLFEMALEILGCKPEEMLYIGDNPVRDYDAARSVGIPSILLRTEKYDQTRPVMIESLDELMGLMS